MNRTLGYSSALFASLAVLFTGIGNAALQTGHDAPTVTLDHGIFVGLNDVNTSTNKFLGIPFAKPPVGDLRFRLPVANDPYSGTHHATAFGDICSQQAFGSPFPPSTPNVTVNFVSGALAPVTGTQSEDCLTVNVWQPENVASDAKLPVVAWIYGGSFVVGATTQFDGGVIVHQSVKLGQPIIYINMNYRLNAFGFLGGDEVKKAGVGNLALQDQREAFRWIQKYISAFGGDPDKVTIWGESAGAISIGTHLVTNGGNNEGLFHGAIMESGSPLHFADIAAGQGDYDSLVQQTGCYGAADTLECLRQVPFDVLKAAVDTFPNFFDQRSLNWTWEPRVDGKFLVDHPQQLVLDGQVADVPFIAGDCDDEGTLFTLALANITTEQEVRDYVVSNYLPDISSSDLDRLLTLYPQDPSQGSPYDTGDLNVFTPQFKRLASFQGDFVFQQARRFFLHERSDKQKAWSFLSKRVKTLPVLGAYHSTDLIDAYGQTDLTEYVVNFVNDLDPNGPTVSEWPRYSNLSPQLLTLVDGPNTTITLDTFRAEPLAFMQKIALAHPL